MNDIFITLLTTISGGYGRLFPIVDSLFYYMVAFEVFFFGLFLMYGVGDIVSAVRKIITIIVIYTVFVNFPDIHKWLIDGAVGIGLLTSGSHISTADAVNPSKVFDHGMALISKIFDSIGWYEILTAKVIFVALLAFVIGLIYIGMAIIVILAFTEFYILGVLSILFLPFGTFRPTAFLAEKTFSMLIGFFIKILMLTFIMGLIEPLYASLGILNVESSVTYQTIFQALGLSALAFFLMFSIPGLTASLLTGGQSLNLGAFLGTMLAVGATVGGAVTAGVGAASFAVKTAVGATKMAAGVSSAMRIGAATSGGSRIGGAARGGAQYMGGAIKNMASGITNGFSNAIKQGRLRGYTHSGGTPSQGMVSHAGGQGGGGQSTNLSTKIRQAMINARRTVAADVHSSGGHQAPVLRR